MTGISIRERIHVEGYRTNAIAVLLGVSPQLLNYKLNNNRFTEPEKRLLSQKLGRPVSELFPDPDPTPEAA